MERLSKSRVALDDFGRSVCMCVCASSPHDAHCCVRLNGLGDPYQNFIPARRPAEPPCGNIVVGFSWRGAGWTLLPFLGLVFALQVSAGPFARGRLHRRCISTDLVHQALCQLPHPYPSRNVCRHHTMQISGTNARADTFQHAAHRPVPRCRPRARRWCHGRST